MVEAQGTVCAENADGDRQIEAGALFTDVSGGEIDGDVRGRDQVAGVLDSGTDAIAAFADGGIGKTDGVEVILLGDCAAVIDFDVDQVGVNPINGGAKGFKEHGWEIEASVSLVWDGSSGGSARKCDKAMGDFDRAEAAQIVTYGPSGVSPSQVALTDVHL